MDPSRNPVAPDELTRVFVSYAREDKRWLDRDDRHNLIPFLVESLKRHNVVVWYDKELRPGDEFRSNIEAEIDRAQIALLIVSQNFLNSEFIEKQEMPRIANRASQGQMIIVPVLVEPCDWHDFPILADRQMVPGPMPLIDYTESEPAWVKVRAEILDGLKTQIKRIREKQQASCAKRAPVGSAPRPGDLPQRNSVEPYLKRLKRESETGRVTSSMSEAGTAEQNPGSQVAQPPLSASVASPEHSVSSTSMFKVPGLPRDRRKVRGELAVLVVLLAVTAIGGAYYLRSHHAATRLTEKDTIVVADFSNTTGDSMFDDTMKQALSVSLRQSPYLNVLSEDTIAATLRMMTQPPDSRLTPDIARELCQRANSKAYIGGSIANIGSQYIVGLKAINCLSGDVLVQEQETAGGKEKVLDALGVATTKLRTQLGESLGSVQKFDAPLQQETTSSLEALKAMSLGRKEERQKGPVAALPFYQRAIELDPNFASAIEGLGVVYSNLGQIDRADVYLTKAFNLRDRASDREKLVIMSNYYSLVSGESYKAIETFQEWEESYPRDYVAPTNLGSFYSTQGQYGPSADQTQKAILLNPDNVYDYDNLTESLLALDRYDAARKTYDDAIARKLDDDALHLARYGLAFLQSDQKELSDQTAWFEHRPDVEHEMLALEAETESYAGHLKKARELRARAVDSAMRSDNKSAAAVWELSGTFNDELVGEPTAREKAIAAISRAPQSPDAQALGALVLARSREYRRAESLMQDLQKRFPSHTILQSYWLPLIRAQIAMANKQPLEAVDQLQAALPVEFGQPLSTPGPVCLFPVYVRGEAYLAAGQGSAAAAEFQKLLDHRGITWSCATGALARLGLARANALEATTMQGSDADAARVRALTSYKDFLSLWKDADPDIPILKQSKAEYAKLK